MVSTSRKAVEWSSNILLSAPMHIWKNQTAISPGQCTTWLVKRHFSLAKFSYSNVRQHENYFGTDLVLLNRGQMTRTTPEMASPLQTSAPHQWEVKRRNLMPSKIM
ncbi:hypothetical protein AVEN_127943-1 [Araneus ventricosus]|uniref:Uncharacterized protein n=1 Tax=Araneus ventricosus TaxID=182803 RepID=A0A4Y2A073_ARAVE|nr:hypothetical protein AVEN_127943-1 [Araneus ventricosus]